jgi:hypothetical protein
MYSSLVDLDSNCVLKSTPSVISYMDCLKTLRARIVVLLVVWNKLFVTSISDVYQEAGFVAAISFCLN